MNFRTLITLNDGSIYSGPAARDANQAHRDALYAMAEDLNMDLFDAMEEVASTKTTKIN